MKFSPLVLSSLVGAVGATNDFSLRGFFGAESAPVESLEGQVVIDGLLREVSGQDIEAIGSSVISAYNKAYGSSGLTVKSFNAKSAAAFPEPVKGCPKCRPDDDTFETMTLLTVRMGVEV